MAGYTPPSASGFASGRLGLELDASPFSTTNAAELVIDVSGSDYDQYRIVPVQDSNEAFNAIQFNGVTTADYDYIQQDGTTYSGETNITTYSFVWHSEIRVYESKRVGTSAIRADMGSTEYHKPTCGWLEGETAINTIRLFDTTSNTSDVKVRLFGVNA